MGPKDDSLFQKLERMSDLMGLLWYHTAGGPDDGSKDNIVCPKYIIRVQIAPKSSDTRSIMDLVLKKLNQKKADWPGIYYLADVPTTGEAFNALLGTLHGAAVGFMLTQHKTWFGQKKISKITVWYRSKVNYNMMFTTANV
jgi:hypothetical protein